MDRRCGQSWFLGIRVFVQQAEVEYPTMVCQTISLTRYSGGFETSAIVEFICQVALGLEVIA